MDNLEEEAKNIPESQGTAVNKSWTENQDVVPGKTNQDVVQSQTNQDVARQQGAIQEKEENKDNEAKEQTDVFSINKESLKEEVKEIKHKIESKEIKEKLNSQLTWALSTLFIGGAGIFTAIIIKRTAGDAASSADLVVGGVGDMLGAIIKAGWIIGVSGLIVGLVLMVIFLNTYLKSKRGKTEQEAKNEEAENEYSNNNRARNENSKSKDSKNDSGKDFESGEKNTEHSENLKNSEQLAGSLNLEKSEKLVNPDEAGESQGKPENAHKSVQQEPRFST